VPNFFVNVDSLKKLACYPYGNIVLFSVKLDGVIELGSFMREDVNFNPWLPQPNFFSFLRFVDNNLNTEEKVKLNRVFLSFSFIQVSSPGY